jgi:hypothetical protein
VTPPHDFQAVHVDVSPAATVDKPRAAQLELLDDNEIIELSIKPSLWFVAIVSLRFVAFVAFLVAIVLLTAPAGGAYWPAYVLPSAILACLARVVFASLQWASRVYILTNRRVMRLAGVVTVEVTDCLLKRVTGTNLELGTLPRLFGLGSIRIVPLGNEQKPVFWEYVAPAGDIYAKLVRAIKKAQSKP